MLFLGGRALLEQKQEAAAHLSECGLRFLRRAGWEGLSQGGRGVRVSPWGQLFLPGSFVAKQGRKLGQWPEGEEGAGGALRPGH